MSAAYDPATGLSFNPGNPGDEGVFAEFYLNAVQNNFESAKRGKPYFEDQLFIRIRTPGDRRSEIDRPAKDADKDRFPRQWMQYERGATAATSGVPLEEWPLMTPAAIRNYKALNIDTVEAMAAVTDGNLQNLGPGARQTRDAAKAYLERAEKGAAASALAAENADLRARMAAMEANHADLLAAMARKKDAENA